MNDKQRHEKIQAILNANLEQSAAQSILRQIDEAILINAINVTVSWDKVAAKDAIVVSDVYTESHARFNVIVQDFDVQDLDSSASNAGFEACFCDTDNWFPCDEEAAKIYQASGDYKVRIKLPSNPGCDDEIERIDILQTPSPREYNGGYFAYSPKCNYLGDSGDSSTETEGFEYTVVLCIADTAIRKVITDTNKLLELVIAYPDEEGDDGEVIFEDAEIDRDPGYIQELYSALNQLRDDEDSVRISF